MKTSWNLILWLSPNRLIHSMPDPSVKQHTEVSVPNDNEQLCGSQPWPVANKAIFTLAGDETILLEIPGKHCCYGENSSDSWDPDRFPQVMSSPFPEPFSWLADTMQIVTQAIVISLYLRRLQVVYIYGVSVETLWHQANRWGSAVVVHSCGGHFLMHRNPWHKLRLEPTTPRSSGLYELLYKNIPSWTVGEGVLPPFSQFIFHTLWCKDEIYGCHGKVPEVFLGEAKRPGCVSIFLWHWCHVHSWTIRLMKRERKKERKTCNAWPISKGQYS